MCGKKRVDFFAIAVHNRHFLLQSIIEQKINVPKILRNTYIDKMMTLTDKMAGKKVFGI